MRRQKTFRLDAETLESRIVPAFSTLRHTLLDATPVGGEAFATSVASSGNFALVGFPNETVEGQSYAGVVHVFDLVTGTLQRTISNPSPAPDDHFGSVLAIDGNLIVIGVPDDDAPGGSGSGSAYVFDATTGAQLHWLHDPTPSPNERFGSSVAISGTRVAVGNPGSASPGEVIVFDAVSGTQTARILDSSGGSTGFGRAVAFAGGALAIGAPFVDAPGTTNSGAVHIFDAATGQFQRTIANPTPNTGENFGDVLTGAVGRIAVGVPTDNPSGLANAGAAYLYDVASGTLIANLANPDPDSGDRFGASLAISENRVVVGTPGDFPQGIGGAGSTYVYATADGQYLGAIPNPHPANQDQFGRAVTVSTNRVLVGVPDAVASAGAAYIFTTAGGPLILDDEKVIDEDSGITSISVLLNDQTTPTPGGNLTVLAVTQPSRGIAAVAGNGTHVTYIPNPNFSGTDTFTYTATDDAGNTGTATVTVIVNAINDRPTISNVADQAVVVSTALGPIAFTVGDVETPAGNLVVSVRSSNTALVSPGSIFLGGSGANRTLSIIPTAGMTGTATVTLEVTDGGGLTAAETFELLVHQIPTLSVFSDRRIVPNSSTGPIAFVVGDDFTPAGALVVQAASSDTALVPTANIVFGGSGVGRTVTVTPAPGMTGSTTIAISVTDGNGATVTNSFVLTVGAVGLSRNLVVSGVGGVAPMHTPDATGTYATTPAVTFVPFPGYEGSIRTANADVDGNGTEDTILVTGPGTPLRVMVLGGESWTPVLVPAFDPFGGDFTGGGFVSAMDLDGDGSAEFVVTPDQGGGPRVSIFSLVGGDAIAVRANFLGIDDPNFRGGARSALGDVNGDGTPDLAVSAGFLGGPRTALFNGTTLFASPTRLINDFFAFPGRDATTLRNGVFVSAGDVDGDGKAELIFGGGPGGAPRVFILSGAMLSAGDVAGAQANPVANFFVAGNSTDRGGVRLTVKDADGDRKADVIVGSGEGSPAMVRIYLGQHFTTRGEPGTFQQLDMFGGEILAGGVFVG